MDTNPWQVGAWIVAVVGGLTAAGLGIWQSAQNRQQRARELRWKEAESAKQLIDEMFHETLSNSATLMLDSWDRTYPVPGAGALKITSGDVLEALKVESFETEKTENAKNDFVRDCFDMFFYYLDRFEHFIQAGLTSFDDIRFPVQYYVDLMAEDKAVFVSYIEFCEYKNIWRFLDRFPEWRKKQLPPGNVLSRNSRCRSKQVRRGV